MNLSLSEDQILIKDSAEKFLSTHYSFEKRKEFIENKQYSHNNWKSFAELGWLGIAFNEEVGGFDGNIKRGKFHSIRFDEQSFSIPKKYSFKSQPGRFFVYPSSIGDGSFRKFYNYLTPILESYAKENSISLILKRENILIGKTNLDISQNILKIFNKKIKTIKVN